MNAHETPRDLFDPSKGTAISRPNSSSLAGMSDMAIVASAGRDNLSGDPTAIVAKAKTGFTKGQKCYHKTAKVEVTFDKLLDAGKALVMKANGEKAKTKVSNLVAL